MCAASGGALFILKCVYIFGGDFFCKKKLQRWIICVLGAVNILLSRQEKEDRILGFARESQKAEMVKQDLILG